MLSRVVQALWNQNNEKIVANSVHNCHAHGVDSIVLVDAPEQRIRLFSATKSHTLWKNSGEHTYSVAYHPHHCDVTLIGVTGELYNIVIEQSDKGNILLSKFEYKSQFNGKGGFKFDTKERFKQPSMSNIWAGKFRSMKAEDIHTIYIPKGKEASWIVVEGNENPEYESVCYSNDDLECFSFKGMYTNMNEYEVKKTLKKSMLL
jgi:hypothetical protein